MLRPKINLILEAFIAVQACIALALAGSYTTQLWHALIQATSPPNGPFVRIQDGIPLFAIYCLPPLITTVLALINMYFYHRDLLGPLHALAVASVLAACWLTVAVIWGHCHDRAHHSIGLRRYGSE